MVELPVAPLADDPYKEDKKTWAKSQVEMQKSITKYGTETQIPYRDIYWYWKNVYMASERIRAESNNWATKPISTP